MSMSDDREKDRETNRFDALPVVLLLMNLIVVRLGVFIWIGVVEAEVYIRPW